MSRSNLISLLACSCLSLLCLGLAPAESRGMRQHTDLTITKYVELHGSSSHMEALLGKTRPSPDTYRTVRDAFFHYEEARSLGFDVELNSRELQANETIMGAKLKEYTEGEITPHLFKPSQHIFDVLDAINQTELFQLLKRMPKGAVLHAHDTALCSTEAIIALTYRDNLWICQQTGDLSANALRFSKLKPEALTTRQSCDWQLLSEVRTQYGTERVDKYLAERLTLYPTTNFQDGNAAWARFMEIFGLLDGLLMYAPVWADYYYKALEEFLADGVQYLEFRTTLPTVRRGYPFLLGIYYIYSRSSPALRLGRHSVHTVGYGAHLCGDAATIQGCTWSHGFHWIPHDLCATAEYQCGRSATLH